MNKEELIIFIVYFTLFSIFLFCAFISFNSVNINSDGSFINDKETCSTAYYWDGVNCYDTFDASITQKSYCNCWRRN